MPFQSKQLLQNHENASTPTPPENGCDLISAGDRWCIKCFRFALNKLEHDMAGEYYLLKSCIFLLPEAWESLPPKSLSIPPGSTVDMALLPAPDVSLAISATAIALVYELLTGNASDVHKLTEHVKMPLDFENDDPAGPGAMSPGDKWHHYINPMGRVRLVAVVLDLWTAFDAILKAHGKEYGIDSTNYTPEHARQYREHVIQRQGRTHKS